MKNITDFSQKLKRDQKGFTLIELLVVIGILAILLAIVLVAVNPGQQFDQANDTQRQADVTTISNAIAQYMADNAGDLPGNLATGDISSADIDLCDVENGGITPDYVADLPMDPSDTVSSVTGGDSPCDAATTGYDTGYSVEVDANDRVTVTATDSAGSTISVTR